MFDSHCFDSDINLDYLINQTVAKMQSPKRRD